jgi:hypothetical protein
MTLVAVSVLASANVISISVRSAAERTSLRTPPASEIRASIAPLRLSIIQASVLLYDACTFARSVLRFV